MAGVNTDEFNEIINNLNILPAEKDENGNWWWSYWSDSSFEEALLKRDLNHQIVKHILWKYENYLLSKEKQGYAFMQMEQIIKPEVEHIAPQTPTNETPIAAGYCKYDDDHFTL